MRRRAASWSFVVLLVSLFLSAVPLYAQFPETGDLAGQVRVERGDALSKHLLVSLETRGMNVGQTYTDNEGKFVFYDLRANVYHVIINDEQYQPVNESVALDPARSRVTIVQVIVKGRGGGAPTAPSRPSSSPDLTGNAPEEQDPERSRVSGGNPYMVNLGDYKKQFPSKALKEFEAGVRSDQKGHSEDAAGHYKKALQIAPDFYPARNNLGSAHLNRGDFKTAEAEFEQVTKANPSDAAAYFNLGNVFLLTKRYKEAGGTIREGLQKQPNSALGNFLLGSLCQQTGQAAEAERALRRALDLDPGLAKAHLALVNLYLQQRRTPDVVAELKAFLKAAPDDPFAPKAREVLKKLQAQLPATAVQH